VNYYVDYFGTRVAAFDVLAKHSALAITARSLVEVRARPLTHPDTSWEALARDAQRSIGTVEMLSQTLRTAPHPEVADLAAGIAAQHENPSHAALAITMAVGEAVEYVPGATEVQSTGAEAWVERKGVCQDMAHIALGALRSVGIPARYVSGYLHPKPDAEIGETVAGESHAWVEWYCGEWRGFDPTNSIDIGDRHVTVGRGRDYNDVAPLRGVYAGPFGSSLFVTVEITRES
jgi:transglutaminase-like putative cysteine protease